MIKNSEILSVKQLLEKLTDKDNSFKLFIGQRTFKWKKLKVTNLIDSILRGFPIGSMLVDESDESKECYSLSQKKQFRQIEKKGKNKIIIDGQQRCVSIKASYTKEGFYNKTSKTNEILWINVINENKFMKEFDEKKSQKYLLHWNSSGKNLNKLNSQERKEEFFKNMKYPENGWIELYKLKRIIISHIMKDTENISKIRKILLKELNCETQIKTKYMDEIIKVVYHSLVRENIPIHYLQKENDGFNDLFHIFIRINTGGEQLGAVDVFFTGIKKYWANAEEYLKYIINEDSIFDRKSAITILARCAGMSLKDNSFDPYRMGLNQITRNTNSNKEGKERYPLVMKMERLIKDENTKFVESIKWVTKIMRNNLYYASKQIDKNIIMPVIGWVYQYISNNKSPDIDKLKDKINDIIKFLFWAQILGSRSYGRGMFDRECFRVSWEAGKKNKPFPWKDGHFQNMCFNYERVRNKTPKKSDIESFKDENNQSAKTIRKLLFSNHLYFLSIYQKIPFKNNKIDWDHLIAYNYARRKLIKEK